MSSSLQRFKPSAAVPAAPMPTLPNGNDNVVADKLKSLIADANDGLIRIARLGAFIDHIRDNLPHGHFKHWMAAHCADVSERSVYRWRSICAGILRDAGLSGQKLRALERPLYEVLDLPFGELSAFEQNVVSKIRDAAENTGYRKLESRPIRKKPALTPEDEVAIKKKAAHDRWLHVMKSLEVCYDDLHLAVAHDATIIHTIEDFRIKLGTQLSKVTAAIKSRRA